MGRMCEECGHGVCVGPSRSENFRSGTKLGRKIDFLLNGAKFVLRASNYLNTPLQIDSTSRDPSVHPEWSRQATVSCKHKLR